MTTGIFIPCFIDQILPDTGFSMVKVLKAAGADVVYKPSQTCCGQIAFNNGYWDEAKCLGEKFIKDFMDTDYVVGPSASCATMVRNHYPALFDNSAWHNENKYLGKKIYEFCDFLVNLIRKPDLGAIFEARISFHDSCQALRDYGLKDEPRTLLSHVKGLELIEMNDSDVCCGFGGSFSVKYGQISAAMAEIKVQNALYTDAEYIVSTEASCLMHLDSYIKKHKLPIKTMHIADLLASGIE